MKLYNKSIDLRKMFLNLANRWYVFLIIALTLVFLFVGFYYIKNSKINNDVTYSYVYKLNEYNDKVKVIKKTIFDHTIERKKLLNEYTFKSNAKAQLVFSIKNLILRENSTDVAFFLYHINNTINNNNIIDKLSLFSDEKNEIFKINISNKLNDNKDVLLTAYIQAVDDETLNQIINSISDLVLKDFSSFESKIINKKVILVNKEEIIDINDEIMNIDKTIEKLNQELINLENSYNLIITEKSQSFYLAKKSLILGVFVFLFLCFIILVLEVTKRVLSPFILDLNFISSNLLLPTLAILDSERYNKNFLTKLFMRKSIYSNNDAYGIISVYIKEKQNLSIISFLDLLEEKKFKDNVNVDVLNCNSCLSSLFDEIEKKNNFIFLVDMEKSKTDQVVEVYNFIKKIELDIYGTVIYTC